MNLSGIQSRLYLAENNVGTTKEDKLLGIIETDWYSIIKSEESFWWWGDSEVNADLEKLRFTIEEKSHQRTASLRVELIDFKGDHTSLLILLKQQLEVRALNQVVRRV